MKITIPVLVLFFGYITPIYSQINLHRKSDATREQFQNKKNGDFDYKFVDKFMGSSIEGKLETFNMSPLRPAQNKFTRDIYSGYVMPCVHPKSGDDMPCLKPQGTFPMRVFYPKNVTWGILW